jgi:hypothetical protein
MPLVIAVIVGAAIVGALVWWLRRRRPGGAARVRPIDPFVLSEPWRGYVQRMQSARLRFERTVGGLRGGPTRQRLAEMAQRLDRAVQQAWDVSVRGDEIDAAVAQLELDSTRARLAALPAGDDETTAAVRQSLQAQLDAGERLRSGSQTARERLQVLDARFDELVARAAEVTVTSADDTALRSDVDDLVTELEAVRLALAEANGGRGQT